MWAPDYATVAQLKKFVRVNDTVDDAEIALALATASRSIDHTTNRQFGKLDAATGRFYTAEFDNRRRRWVVEIDDLMTQAGLLVEVDPAGDDTFATPVESFALQPLNAAGEGRPWTKLVVAPGSAVTGREGGVMVTAEFGWAEVPPAIVQATLLQASRVLARRESPFGVAGSPELGSELRLLAKLDPDVAVAVAPYRRWWAAA